MFELIILRNLIDLQNNIQGKKADVFRYPKIISLYKAKHLRRLSNKKRTQNEYILDLERVNPTVVVVGEYVNANTKITHHCLIHDIDFETTPSRALRGCGCPKCHFERSGKAHRKAAEDYKKELLEKNSPVIPLEDYIDVKTPILHKNTICGHEFITTPGSVLGSLYICPKCFGDKIKKALSKTDAEYKQELFNKGIPAEPLEEYKGANTKILHRFQCGHIVSVKPGHVLEGHGCRICESIKRGIASRMTQEEFEERMLIINPDIKIIGIFITTSDRIECQCKLCALIWSPYANSLMGGHGCPNCAGSKGEQFIANFLDKNNILYNPQKTFQDLRGIGGKVLRIDFYLPDYNTIIEYNGEQHERPVDYFGGEESFEIVQEHDKRKKEYAQNNNMGFITIWYYDFDRIEEILIKELNLKCIETVEVA